MSIYLDFYTTKHIGTDKYARTFFNIIHECGLPLEKIGLYEPIRKPFELEEAILMWTKEEPGVYDLESEKMIGKSGGMLGKGKGWWFDTHWWLHPNELSLNHLTISVSKKLFKSKRNEIILLFRKLLMEFEAVYGFITDRESFYRQHITGTLRERLNGVFWINYFSPLFVEYLNDNNALYNYSWEKVENDNVGGVITQLTSDPFDPELLILERNAQEYFGLEKFNGEATDYPDILKK